MKTKKIITSREIGLIIKKRRKELGISQEELAETLNISYQQVQRYENGLNRLNVENIQTVANALKVPVTDFFTFDKMAMIAEDKTPYRTTDEDRLLKHFRKIEDRSSKQTVIQVARLAAKSKQ